MAQQHPWCSLSDDLDCSRSKPQWASCDASPVYIPTGIDLRLIEGDQYEFRRTRLCADAPTLHTFSADWHGRLYQAGWADVVSGSGRQDWFGESFDVGNG